MELVGSGSLARSLAGVGRPMPPRVQNMGGGPLEYGDLGRMEKRSEKCAGGFQSESKCFARSLLIANTVSGGIRKLE